MEGLTKFRFCSGALFYIFATCTAVDTIAANQIIREGDTLVSASEDFELGLFRPSNSSQNQYLGIWYKKISTGTVVWVANREAPLTNTTGALTLNHDGILLLQNTTNSTIWSTNSSVYVRNPVAQLLDTGNLVIREESDNSPQNFIWQSFDYPTDTFLPEMKIGKDLITGLDRYIRSWKSANDPSPGDHTVSMDINGYPQILQKVRSTILFRLGPWIGNRFTGIPSLKPNPIYTYDFVFNQKEVYYEYKLITTSVVTRMILTPDGNFQRLQWIDRTQGWLLYLEPATDPCARYALCGAYGSCNVDNSPACGCLKGFVPTNPDEWSRADWVSGCTRRTKLTYGNGDGFRKYSGMKLPDTRQSWFNQSMNLAECQRACKSNGSCTAYSNMDFRGCGNGCILWFGNLIDLREYPENGQDLYIRMAASEIVKDRRSSMKRRIRFILIPVLSVLTLGLGLCLYVYKWRKLKKKEKIEPEVGQDYNKESQNEDLELPLYSLSTLLEATNNFSFDNQVGEGGFGTVYKGVLESGQEIAVKRLSKTSTQGLEQLKNEVICISKLQHRNLVKLLGCYIKGEEKMLVYEYMSNKSLDSFIFDESKSRLLDWPKRFHIINGISRGLLYLHQDSRLRIIHRDLKAGNILLDIEMNPKISDFGLAKSIGGNENKANTNRVAGTYGYMSPEYAGDGIFSVKSDVFSFGVLVLEIVSGRRNSGFFHHDHNHNLLGHAWILQREGRSMELVDASIHDSFYLFEVLRSIQVALLCVQQAPDDRPTMSSVVLMLGSDGVLPQPKQPGYFTEISILESESSSGTCPTSSTKTKLQSHY